MSRQFKALTNVPKLKEFIDAPPTFYKQRALPRRASDFVTTLPPSVARGWHSANDHLPTALLLLRGVASPMMKVPLELGTGSFWMKSAQTRGAVRLQHIDLKIKQTIPQVRTEVEKAINERIKKGGKILDHGVMPLSEARSRFGDQVLSFLWEMENWEKNPPENFFRVVEIEGVIAAYVPKVWEFLSDIKDLQQVQIWQCRIKDVRREVVLDVQVYPDGDRKVPWKRLPKRMVRFSQFPQLLLKPKPQSSKNSRRCDYEDVLDNFGSFY